jgi:hypothetical protein
VDKSIFSIGRWRIISIDSLIAISVRALALSSLSPLSCVKTKSSGFLQVFSIAPVPPVKYCWNAFTRESQMKKKIRVRSMRVKSGVKAGGVPLNHNRTLIGDV